VDGCFCFGVADLKHSRRFAAPSRRELWEETGIEVEEGHLSWLWTIRYRARLDRVPMDVEERFFQVHTQIAKVSGDNFTEQQKVTIKGFRWWSLEELTTQSPIALPLLLSGLFNNAQQV
jgi:hypothetical protein